MSKTESVEVKTASEFIFENAMDEKTRVDPLISDKIYLDIIDSNSNNYENVHLLFNMPSLALKNGIHDISDSVLRIPIQVTIKSDVAFNENEVHRMLNLKGDAASIIGSFQLHIDRKLVKAFVAHNEIPAYFRKITSMTEDYSKQMASSLSNFNLDDGVTSYTADKGEHQTGNTAVTKKCARLAEWNDADPFRNMANMGNVKKSHFVRDIKTITTPYVAHVAQQGDGTGVAGSVNAPEIIEVVEVSHI